MNGLKLAILALAAVLIATSLVDTGFGSPPYPLGSLFRRAETVLVVRMTSHTETNAVFEVAHVLRGDATLQQLALGNTRAGCKLPKNTRSLFLFSQGDNYWGPPKDSFQVGQPIKGQASYRGWILTDGPGESKEELQRLKQLVKQNPYKPGLHGKLSARILLPAKIKPGDGARPAKLDLTNTGEEPVRVLTRCYPTASTFTGWLSVRFRPQSEQHTPSIEELAKSVVELAPGESTTFPFEFTDPGNKMPQVTATYEVSEELAERLNVWFGRVKAKRIVFTRTAGGVLRVLPPEQLPLCGSRLSIEEALKQGFAFVAACETLESVMKEANLGRSNWIQEFWPLEVLGGNEPGVCVFHLDYRFCDVPDRRERGVGKGERVIWIVRRDSNRLPPWEGVKALIDTPENRAAVLAALPKEQSKRAATLEDVSQRVRTQAATATGRIRPAEEDGKAAPPECGAGGTARLTAAQRRIADAVVGDVIAKIQARIAQRQRLAESIAELAKRDKSQRGGTSAGDVAICAYSCRRSRVPVPEALNEKVVDDIIFQYRNPPEGSWSDTYPHQKACVWALGELGHCKAVPVIMECLADKEKPYGAAWDALRHISDEALIPVIARQMDIKPRLSAYPATGGLGRLGRPALPLLKRILEAPDPQGKEGAIGALVVICLPECLPPLERLAESGELKSNSARRKLAAAIATIRCRAVDKTYVPPKWSYEDRCRMHHLVAVALSIEHQVKGSEDLADEAEAALIEIGPSLAAAAVRPQLSSRTHTDVGGGGDYWPSRKAAALVVRFGEPAIPALLDALNDYYGTARWNASHALKRITGEDFGTDYAAWREWCLSAGKLNPPASADAAKLPHKNKADPKVRRAAAKATKQPPPPETEAGGGEPWLQFRVTEKDLDKIVVSRCEFVFPKGVEIGDSACFGVKDGYLFEAKEMLYVTDRAGKLVVEHKLPQPSHRGGFHRGDDWFGYSDSSAGRLRVFHTNGKEIGNVAVPQLCMAVVSRDGSRVFFLQIRDPDARRLAGPIVADVRTGKILSEHHFGFAGLMARGYMERTQAGLVAQRTSSGGLICFDSSGEVAWQSPFRASQRSRPAGQYVLAVHDGPEAQALKFLDGKGQVVLEKPASSTGCTRLLPDGERLLLICRENNQMFRQLYRLKDATRLWFVPLRAGRSDDYEYACLSPDGARLASFIRNSPGNNRAIDKDGRYTFTIAVLDLATGAELLRQELPFREEITPFRQPRWTDAKTIELIPADFLYRIRLKF